MKKTTNYMERFYGRYVAVCKKAIEDKINTEMASLGFPEDQSENNNTNDANNNNNA